MQALTALRRGRYSYIYSLLTRPN